MSGDREGRGAWLSDMAELPPPIVEKEPRYRQETSAAMVPLSWQGEVPARPLPVWHLDGVTWFDADPPPARHEHWPQTVGLLDVFEEVHRCACGAAREPMHYRRGGGWMQLGAPRVAEPVAAPSRLAVARSRWARIRAAWRGER